MVVRATAVFAAVMVGVAGAAAQTQPLVSRDVPLAIDSGEVAAADEGGVVYSAEVRVPGASWVRLTFGDVVLAGDPASNGAVIRIMSLLDGDVQTLNAETLEHWHFTSAYFNGDAVFVELIAQPGTGASRLVVTSVAAGEPDYSDRSICAGVDDRVLSDAPGNARLMPIGCTAWLINDVNHTFLTAGHCTVTATSVAQFNVPLSTATGGVVNPPARDQYPVELTSSQGLGGGTGNDWRYFGTFPNSETGLTAYQAEGAAYQVAATVPAAAGQTIRITGYGTTASPAPRTWSQVQKTHTGPYASFAGSLVRYAVDTTGGNSGSPVVLESTGEAIGIHTHAGCNSTGGSNQGTGVNHSGLRAALASPRGVCRSGLATPSGDLYVIGDLNNNFGTIATAGAATGMFAKVSQLGAFMQGLAYDGRNDRFLAIDSARTLYAISAGEGTASALGTVTGTTLVLNGLAYDSGSRVLYAIAASNGQLFTINMATLEATAIGAPGGGNIGGIDAGGGLIMGLNDLATGTRLVLIHPNTGVQTDVGALGTGITDCNGLAYDSRTGALYTVNATTEALLRIDASTGAATVVGATNGLFGAAYGMTARTGFVCSADYDGDGDVGTDADIEAFFACVGGNCCQFCGPSDFDGDGDSGTDADVQAFFRALAGGGC